MDIKTFEDFNLIHPLQRALRDNKYIVPTPVQIQAIPWLLEGRDLLGCAQTGTGKTAAFALPILQHIVKNRCKYQQWSVRALIITPTRELASQIFEKFKDYGKYLKISQALVFGGVRQNPQVKSLAQGVDILVATPGRLLDLMNQGYIKLDKVEIFVLDEADRMLDMGFFPDIRRILAPVPKKRQTMLFSATLPPKIMQLSKVIVSDPINVDVSPDKPVVELIDQRLMLVEQKQKAPLLIDILQDEAVKCALVFTRTKHRTRRLVRILKHGGIRADCIHGDKTQNARERALKDFRLGRIRVLVATDIATRGIDVEGISHVFNYDIPVDPETYIHRIGRTARAGCAGIAISFCSVDERGYIRDIEHLIKQTIPETINPTYHSDVPLSAKVDRPQVQKPRRRMSSHKQTRRRSRGGSQKRRRR